MRHIYVFYVDVFLLQNLCMDFIAVTGSNFLLKRGKSILRLLLVSFIASLSGVVLFLGINNQLLYQLLTHFLLNTAMVAGCFGYCSKQEFLKVWMSTYLFVLLMGGAVEWLWEQNDFFRNYAIQTMTVVIFLCLFVSFFEYVQTFEKNKVRVQLIHQEMKMLLTAYYDSGNQLADPYTGKPVCVLSAEKSKELLKYGKDRMRLVPYHSLGEQSGLLWVMDVERMEFLQGNTHRVIKDVVIGLGEEGFLDGKEYDLLLHAKIPVMGNGREGYHEVSGQINEKGDETCI